MEKLTICIPTINREEPLKKNLDLLLEYINELNFEDRIKLVVYDNCSDDYNRLEKRYGDNPYISLYRQKERVSGEKNFVSVISAAETEWVMLLGDDDYIDKRFLKLVMKYINDKSICSIIPNFYTIDGTGNKISGDRCRDLIVEDVVYEKGSFEMMFKAHQMSGLVFRKVGLIESYKSDVKPNSYCQMYFIGFNIARGKCVHITRYPLANTVIPKKLFNYNIDMLMDHVLYNVYGLNIDDKEIQRLCKYIVKKDTKSRLGNPWAWKKPIEMINKINKYDVRENIKKYIKSRFIYSYIYLLPYYSKKIIKKFYRMCEGRL